MLKLIIFLFKIMIPNSLEPTSSNNNTLESLSIKLLMIIILRDALSNSLLPNYKKITKKLATFL
jgi:hypothetical protein